MMTRKGTYSGEVERTKNRKTGYTVVILDRENGGAWVDGSERYVAMCDHHSTVIDCKTLTEARGFKREPWVFCEECRELVPEYRVNQ